MSKFERITIVLFAVMVILAAIMVACAPPQQYADQTAEINQGYALTIGTPNAQYRTEVLQVSDRVQVLKFYDSAAKTTCYLGIQSISCVK